MKNKITLLYGGAGAGKTYETAKSFLLRASDKQFKIVALRKVGATLKGSVWNNLHTIICDLNIDGWGLVKSKLRFKHINGSIIDCRTPKNINDKYDEYWWEEATEFSKKDFDQLNKSGVHILTFNPPQDNKHWLNNIRERKGTRLINVNYKNNKHIDKSFKKELRNLKNVDADYYNRYCLGKWG